MASSAIIFKSLNNKCQVLLNRKIHEQDLESKLIEMLPELTIHKLLWNHIDFNVHESIINAKNKTVKRHENSPERKYQYQWILSSYKSDCFADENFPDSLDKTNESIQNTATENSNNSNSQSQRYQTANTFVWTVGGNGIRNGSSNNNNNQKQNQFYDSIDSNLASSLYQANGEELAECDSLEKQLSGVSFEK